MQGNSKKYNKYYLLTEKTWQMKTLTVVRFPNGSWSTGGRVSDPDYEECEVYVVPFGIDAEARKQAQSVRRRLVAKALTLPSQTALYHHPLTLA